MLHPGTQIGDWVVQKQISENDDGDLYEAQSVLSKQLYAALRVLPATQLGRPLEECSEALQRLVQVEHPSLAKVIATGNTENGHALFLVREFVDGEHLGEVLNKGALDWATACGIVLQLLEGIQHLHEQGIPHGKIKASNVCLRADGSASLVDCALAVDTQPRNLTEMGHRFGTMAYLPPEVFRGEILDPFLGDIYAMGQLLCELIRGEVSFPDSDQLTVTQRQSRTLSMKLESGPMETGEDIPEELQNLIRHATHPDPKKRTVSAVAFVRSLSGVLDEKVATEEAEAEFRDVSQTSTPSLPTSKRSKFIWLGIGLIATTVGFFYLFST